MTCFPTKPQQSKAKFTRKLNIKQVQLAAHLSLMPVHPRERTRSTRKYSWLLHNVWEIFHPVEQHSGSSNQRLSAREARLNTQFCNFIFSSATRC